MIYKRKTRVKPQNMAVRVFYIKKHINVMASEKRAKARKNGIKSKHCFYDNKTTGIAAGFCLRSLFTFPARL